MSFLRTLLMFVFGILFSFGVFSETLTILEELKNKKQTCFGSVYSWNNCFGLDKFPDGDIYEGEFKNGKRHGKGIYTFADGEKHIGEFKNDTLNGRGISFFISGNKYEGEFKNGKRHGRGVFTFANGEKYTGEYINGKRNGRGIVIFPNGDNYEGEYKNGKRNGEGIYTFANGAKPKEGVWKDGKFLYSKLINKQSTQKTMLSLEFQKEKQKRIKLQRKVNEEERKRKALEQKLASLEKEKQKRIKEERKRKALEKKLAALQSEKKKQKSSNEIGSGFYVSKFRHLVTNQHVVNKCKKITVGDSISKQIPATLIASDKRNDLAILQTISMELASADTKSFIQNLSTEIVPIVSGGLIRAEDVIGGEEVFVAGYPLGNMVSDSMRLVPGLVNATKGYENDITQFETDASIKKGNSGGPIYDKRGNIVGVAVKRLNVSQSDNFNFAIKGTTVKQFLDANGVLTSLANRKSLMSSTDIYKMASKQTVMVICHK